MGRPAPVDATRFVDVLRVREFRWLWSADLQSLLGDQLARVALSVLVFDRTGSQAWTAAVYALTYLPALVGGIALSPFTDRLPRRALLVWGDLTRAGLLAVMAVPSVPLPLLAVLLAVATIVGTPWKAAETALVMDILDGRGYALGSGLRIATLQGSQLIGFAAGGAVVGLIGVHPALAADAASFAVSALLIRLAITARPPAAGTPRHWADGIRTIAASPALRTLVGLAWLSGLFIVPEGLAVPYAAEVGGGPAATGLLLAAGPAGVFLGAPLYVRLLPDRTRAVLLGPLATLTGVPLVLCALHPGLVVSLVLWTLSGLAGSYQVQVFTEFGGTVSPAHRGQAVAVAGAGLLAVQGIGLLLGGLVADLWSTHGAVAAAGGAGIVLAGALTVARAVKPGRVDRPVATPA